MVHSRRRKSAPRGPIPRELLYGLAPVQAALSAGRRHLRRLSLKGGKLSPRLAELHALAAERGVSVEERSAPELEQLCGSATHQGAVLACGPLPLGDEAGALALAEGVAPDAPPPLLVALDQVEDPRNLGAVVRACAVFGAAAVVLPRHHAAPLSPAASKASAGLLETFPLHQVANLARFLETARGRGWWVYGTAEAGGAPLPGVGRDRPLVLVLGSEGQGLRPLVQRCCDLTVTIPTAGGPSLNVASAAAVVLYHLSVVAPAGGGSAPGAGLHNAAS